MHKFKKFIKRFLPFFSSACLLFACFSFPASAANYEYNFPCSRPQISQYSCYIELATDFDGILIYVTALGTFPTSTDDVAYTSNFFQARIVDDENNPRLEIHALGFKSTIVGYYYQANGYYGLLRSSVDDENYVYLTLKNIDNIYAANGYNCSVYTLPKNDTVTFSYGNENIVNEKLDSLLNSSYFSQGSGVDLFSVAGIQYLRGAITDSNGIVIPTLSNGDFAPAYISEDYGSDVTFQYAISNSKYSSIPAGTVLFLHFSLYFEKYNNLEGLNFQLTCPDNRILFSSSQSAVWDNLDRFKYLGQLSYPKQNFAQISLDFSDSKSDVSNYLCFRVPIEVTSEIKPHSSGDYYYYNFKIILSAFKIGAPSYSNPDSSISSGIGDVESGEEAIVSGAQGSYDSAVSSGNSTVLNFFNSAGNSLIFVKTIFNNLVSGNIHIIVIASIMLAILPVLINVAGGLKK